MLESPPKFMRKAWVSQNFPLPIKNPIGTKVSEIDKKSISRKLKVRRSFVDKIVSIMNKLPHKLREQQE